MANSILKGLKWIVDMPTETLGGDVMARFNDSCRPHAITFYLNSNNPTGNPGGEWGSYVIIKATEDDGVIIYVDNSRADICRVYNGAMGAWHRIGGGT